MLYLFPRKLNIFEIRTQNTTEIYAIGTLGDRTHLSQISIHLLLVKDVSQKLTGRRDRPCLVYVGTNVTQSQTEFETFRLVALALTDRLFFLTLTYLREKNLRYFPVYVVI